MIETIENGIQLVTTGICTAVALRKGILLQSRAWIMLTLASGVFFLGDLYWELFLILYGKTPEYSYIPYLSWYAAYLFLLLLLYDLRDKNDERHRSRILWIIPVFTVGMCIFYLQWGDWVGNIITALLMCLLIWNAVEGLLSIRAQKADHPETKCKKVWIYILVLLFCLEEYGAWTASCFWTDVTLMNPYFWFDIMLSAMFLLFPAALGKAVDR